MENSKKLRSLATSVDSTLLQEAEARIQNHSWLKYSQKIAIIVLKTIKTKNISQKELAITLGVSPQYVNKLVKGREKLNLETISKLEEALDISLIEIPMPKASKKVTGKMVRIDFTRDIKRGTFDTYKMAK